jgi:predicted DNA-binding protein
MLYARGVTLTTSIPVRFTEDVSNRLKAISDRSGVPVAQLVRIATEEYLKSIEQTGQITIDVSNANRVAERPKPNVSHGEKRYLEQPGRVVELRDEAARPAAASSKPPSEDVAAALAGGPAAETVAEHEHAQSEPKPEAGEPSGPKPSPRKGASRGSKGQPLGSPGPAQK